MLHGTAATMVSVGWQNVASAHDLVSPADPPKVCQLWQDPAQMVHLHDAISNNAMIRAKAAHDTGAAAHSVIINPRGCFCIIS